MAKTLILQNNFITVNGNKLLRQWQQSCPLLIISHSFFLDGIENENHLRKYTIIFLSNYNFYIKFDIDDESYDSLSILF